MIADGGVKTGADWGFPISISGRMVYFGVVYSSFFFVSYALGERGQLKCAQYDFRGDAYAERVNLMILVMVVPLLRRQRKPQSSWNGVVCRRV